MIHGAGGGSWEWVRWRRVFEEAGWQVLAENLVPSGLGIAQTRLKDYLDQVVDSCEKLTRVDAIVGASLGGLIAIMAAELVQPSALVLVNPVPPSGLPSNSLPYDEVIRWSTSPLSQTLEAMKDCSYRAAKNAHARWRDESGRVLNEARAGAGMRSVSCHSLVIAGALDQEVPIEHSRNLSQALGGDFIALGQCGHLGPLLGPAATMTALRAERWLRNKIHSRI